MYLANWHLFGWTLIIPLGLIGYIYWIYHNYEEKLTALGDKNTLKTLHNLSPKKAQLKNILLILSVFFIVFALLKPQWGLRKEKVSRTGLDIIVAMDISASMLAEDIRPSRLEKSIIEINKILKSLTGDRIGLITFSGSATTICPLTMDYGAIELFLKTLKYYKEPIPGTNIEVAFNKALTMYDFQAAQDKLFIVITDGESHDGNLESIKSKAKAKGIIVVPVAVGTSGGQPIPDFDKNGVKQGYKKDKNDKIVISHVDINKLKEIATIGPYKLADSSDSISYILKDFKHFKRSKLMEEKISIYAQRYQIFLFIGFLLLLLSYIISEYQERIYK